MKRVSRAGGLAAILSGLLACGPACEPNYIVRERQLLPGRASVCSVYEFAPQITRLVRECRQEPAVRVTLENINSLAFDRAPRTFYAPAGDYELFTPGHQPMSLNYWNADGTRAADLFKDVRLERETTCTTLPKADETKQLPSCLCPFED